jgi:hypothetical protein
MNNSKKTIIPEINEVKLIDELETFIIDCVQDIRFTIEKETDQNLTEQDKSATPTVYKYYLPKREEKNMEEEPITRRNVDFPVPDVTPIYPAIVVRPAEGTTGIETNSTEYEDINIDICIFVKEYELMNRYNFLLLAKKIIINRLRAIPLGVLANYRLQNNLSWKLLDDSQEPHACIVISGSWRCNLTSFGAIDVNLLD